MCKVFISKTEYKDLTLVERDQIKDTYISTINKNLNIKIIKKLSNFISLQDFINISKNKIIGIEKVLDFDINSEPIKIVLENYKPINNPKSYNELINIGLEIINILSNLYSLNIKNFELSIDKLVKNDLEFIIIKDIYIKLSEQNHIYQLCKIIQSLSHNINSNNDENIEVIKNLISRVLNNEINDIHILKENFLDFLNKNSIPNNIKSTNSYTKLDLEILNTKIKYNNIISQIKSDKIVNFNVCSSNNINNFKDFKWLEIIEEQILKEEVNNISFTSYLEINNKFTGIIIVNKEIRIYLYKGYIIGAFNILNKDRDDLAIGNIDIINSLEIRSLNNNLPIILNNLLSSGIILCKENNYFNQDILETLNKISTTNFNGYLTININGYKFFITYNDGIEQFILSENGQSTNVIDKNSLINIILSYHKEIEIEVYILKFSILKYTFNQILAKTLIKINYSNESQGSLNNILKLGNEYIPNKVKESTIRNLLFDKKLPINEKIDVLNGELNISQLIDSSISYKFIKWLITELFFELNKNDYKNIINNIPEINNIRFSSDNKNLNAFLKNNDKTLFISRKGDGTISDFNSFVDLLKKTKVNEEILVSGFYILKENFSNEILTRYKELTKVSSLNIIKFKNNHKSYIRLSNKTGFHLFLITNKFNIFEIINS